MNSNTHSTPTDINTINDLITALSEGERTTYSDIIHSVNISLSEFEDYAYWSEDCYTRNCIIENEKFELILLCWEAGQITPIHDHGGEECWVRVVKGEFQETIYQMDENDELQAVKSSISNQDEISYMIDFMGFHSLKNISTEKSMTLHLYAKPIRNCNSYDEASGKLINRDLVYTTVPASIEN